MVRTLRTAVFAQRLCLLILYAGAAVAQAGSGFLDKELSSRMSRFDVQRQLLEEMNALLGHGASQARLERFKDRMRPMYNALPKNKTGQVEQGVARYALHRYFLSQHAWHLKGLAPDGQRWNASSSTSILKSEVPDFIVELVAQNAMGLEALAVLAATVEDLVHGDAVELLRLAYTTHGLSVDEPLAEAEQEDLVIKTYLLYFVLPWTQAFSHNGTAIADFLPDASSAWPGWEDLLVWVEDLKGATRYRERTEQNPFLNDFILFRSFSSMAQLAAQVVDGVGMFQNIECKMIKNKLMDLQKPGQSDGRVLLGKFYEDFLADREYWFTESPEYLRNLGALDESDPGRLSVIVPNILYGRSNCLSTSSGFHSLCCVNQCDGLMESIEQGIAHPVASPGALVKLVSTLSSDTVVAPRNLSGSLRRKLDRIAAQHAGQVPLHGRLFALWMHHAFPNECPFPHASGADAPLTHAEWSKRWENASTATEEVMQRFVDEAQASANSSMSSELDEAALLWTDEEELVTDLTFEQWGMQESERHLRLPHLLRWGAMCVAVTATFATFWNSMRSSASLARPGGLKEVQSSGSWTKCLGQVSGPKVAELEWI